MCVHAILCVCVFFFVFSVFFLCLQAILGVFSLCGGGSLEGGVCRSVRVAVGALGEVELLVRLALLGDGDS